MTQFRKIAVMLQNILSISKFFTTELKTSLVLLLSTQIAVAFFEVLCVASVIPFFQSVYNGGSVDSEIFIFILSTASILFADVDEQIVAIGFFVFATSMASISKICFFLFREKVFLKMALETSSRLFKKSFEIDHRIYFAQNSSLVISNFSNDLNSVVGSIQGLVAFFSSLFIGVSIITFTFIQTFETSVLIFPLILLFYFFLSFKFIPNVSRNGEISTQAFTQKTGVIECCLNHFSEIFLLHKWNIFHDKFQFFEARFRLSRAKNTLIRELPRPLLELLLVLSFATILFQAVIFNGDVNQVASSLILLVFAAFRLLPHVQTIYNASAGIVSEILAIQRIKSILTRESFVLSRTDDVKPEKFNSLEFVNVEITRQEPSREGEQNQKPVFAGTSFFLQAEDRVFITGKSGSGKTTLLNAMIGLFEPSSGEILVNGQQLRLSKNSWHNSLYFCSSSHQWSPGTIRENLCLFIGNMSRTDKDIWGILKVVELDQEIRGLDDGLDTEIGKLAVGLSLGQSQRLGLARCLLARRPILILDEATNSVEGDKERRILKRISQLRYIDLIVVASHNRALLDLFNKTIEVRKYNEK